MSLIPTQGPDDTPVYEPGHVNIRGIPCEAWYRKIQSADTNSSFDVSFFLPVNQWLVAREDYHRQGHKPRNERKCTPVLMLGMEKSLRKSDQSDTDNTIRGCCQIPSAMLLPPEWRHRALCCQMSCCTTVLIAPFRAQCCDTGTLKRWPKRWRVYNLYIVRARAS